MCGIVGTLGPAFHASRVRAMLRTLRHRGPDAQATWLDESARVGLGQARLRVIDLAPAGDGPLASADGRYVIVFNGEVYNHSALRAELAPYPFRTQTDTEVVLAAYIQFGSACLDRFVGMFAFAIWDREGRRLFAARDRFGVKPLLYVAGSDGTFHFASEAKAFAAVGHPMAPCAAAWAAYLVHGRSDSGAGTFWEDVHALPAGHTLTWEAGRLTTARWYDLAAAVGDGFDDRPEALVIEEYRALLEDSIRLRFRADVPVGVNLSGGLDSSTLLGVIRHVLGAERRVQAFTFTCGDPDYDELPWVQRMIRDTGWPLEVATLRPEAVPALAADVQRHQDAPFGGLPTLAYALLFERARDAGVTVLLDGQGMDEQWAGYDSYAAIARGAHGAPAPIVQGTRTSPLKQACLTPEFLASASLPQDPEPFPDALRNAQYRDIMCTKLPRALRFNDRASMRASRELREPFLDHRLFELALRQPADRRHDGTTSKILLRQVAAGVTPKDIRLAPKRPLQTPQREWLRGPLRAWTEDLVDAALARFGGTWLDTQAVRQATQRYMTQGDDNSFYLWQWLGLGLLVTNSAWGDAG